MGSTLPDSFIILYASTLYVLLLLCSDAAHVLMQLPFFVCCNKDGRDGGVQRSMYSCKDGRAPARQFAADRSQFVNSRICKRFPGFEQSRSDLSIPGIYYKQVLSSSA